MPKLHASRFGLADQKRNVWYATLEEGVAYSAAFDPAFWAHIAHKLRAGDLIEVVPDDSTWRATLYVRAAGRLSADVEEYVKVEFGDPKPLPEGVDYEITTMWRSMHHKFCIMRIGKTGGKEVLAEGYATKEDAERAALDYRKQSIPKAA